MSDLAALWHGLPPAAQAGVVALTALLLLLLILRPRRAADPALARLAEAVQRLDEGQSRLSGGLAVVSETQTAAQMRLMEALERRLEDVQRGMTDTLHGTSTRTARALGELQERLAAIDRAQGNIEKLSGNVLSLQDILSNKQARGAFGEIQLADIVTRALPPDAYAMQATLSNGTRADCLIHLPHPPGPIVIDAKFPLEAWTALRAAEGEREKREAARAFRASVRAHLSAIATKYLIEGETAGGALMFLPSEAIYAELHGHFPDVVREGFDLRVWIVSPTTCMATLNTVRAVLKDVRMKEQAGAIRRELGLLARDLDRLGERVESLDRHFGQAARDLDLVRLSAAKAGHRAGRLEAFEFDAREAEPREAAAE